MKPEPQLTEDQMFCRSVLSEWVCGDHHLPPVKEWGDGIAITYRGDLSTFDFDRLTSLVLLAHLHCVRISIGAASPREVRIIVHRRKPEGNLMQRHPSLEELKARITRTQQVNEKQA